LPEAAILDGIAAIAHRGPDGRGVFRNDEGTCSLGHARLSIIDLSSAGAQPMAARDGRSVIVFNGEIYNYRELRSSIEGELRSTSDTEVLLELLDRHGAGALGRVRGMFAFAFWNGEELLLVRDRVGVKPLFYTFDGNRLAAASEIQALLAMGVGSRGIDHEAVDAFFSHLYVPSPRTGLAGISQLPPGHLLRYRPGRAPHVEPYWTLPTPEPQSLSRSELRGALRDAVRSHLVADVPVGVFLSGGLDSSSITALSARESPDRLRTFCVTFGSEGSYLDERNYAKAVAERFGTEHREIPVDARVAEILPLLVQHFGQPFGNPTAVLSWALSKATREHVKVALAGDGGDELLGGYPRYHGLRLATGLRRVPRGLRSAAAGIATRVGSRAARGRLADRVTRFARVLDLSPRDTYLRWVGHLDRSRKDALLVRPSTNDFEFLAEHWREDLSPVDAATRLDLLTFLPENVLAYGDRMSMAHGLEVRVPLCDHLLVERLAKLPFAEKAPLGVQKGLFRAAMASDLPASVLFHRKIGFNPPIGPWLRGELAPAVDLLLGRHFVSETGIARVDAVSEMVAAVSTGDDSEALLVWALLVVHAWAAWLDGRLPEVVDRLSSRPRS